MDAWRGAYLRGTRRCSPLLPYLAGVRCILLHPGCQTLAFELLISPAPSLAQGKVEVGSVGRRCCTVSFSLIVALRCPMQLTDQEVCESFFPSLLSSLSQVFVAYLVFDLLIAFLGQCAISIQRLAWWQSHASRSLRRS